MSLAAQPPGIDPVDAHVGGRIRLRRLSLGLSQDQLAQAVGVTFQQVQKYERGANRVSAGRLYATAKALKVPVTYFFEGLANPGAIALDPAASADDLSIQAFAYTPEGLELAELFPKISRSGVRRQILELTRLLALEADAD